MKVKFGLKNVHIAPITGVATDGKYTYGDIFRLPGAVNLSLEPKGDQSDFFADDIKYFSAYANNGYSGDLEIAMIIDAFREQIMGEKKDSNGALIESSTDTFKPFAFGFEISGDKKGRRFWYYNCSCSRTKNEAKTIESSKEPSTDALTITSMAREYDNKVRVFLSETAENKTAYDSFFESVYEEVIPTV